MKKSEYRQLKADFHAMQPTPHRGVLDEMKKAHVVLLIASGLSRREAAGHIQCAHTTIGRTAARDPDFAAKLSQAESVSNVQAVNAVRGAMRDPKYWRAAAWMLERRAPEEYAKRDPNSFTAGQVMSFLARLYSETLPLLPAEKVGEFQGLFDETLEEAEAKSGRADRDDEDAEEVAAKGTHLAPRDGLDGANGKPPGSNGQAIVPGTPSGNGHPRSTPAEDGQCVPAGTCGGRSEVPGSQYAVGPALGNGKPHMVCDKHVGPLTGLEAHGGRAAARRTQKAAAPRVVRRFDPAELHQPFQWGAGRGGVRQP